MILLKIMDKLNALKDKALQAGIMHWEENKDDYTEKAETYKEKAMDMKDDLAAKIKEKTKK